MHAAPKNHAFIIHAALRPGRDLIRSLIMALLACLLLLAFPPQEAVAAPPVATVIAQRGEVLVLPHGGHALQRLQLQTEFFEGDEIRTGMNGEAAILFSDGSQVKLNANSSLQITSRAGLRPRQNLFRALWGVIWAHLRPGQRIETPSANIVVRGTEVLLDVAKPDGTTTLTVTEGDVSFFNAQGAVEVAASQQSIAHPGQAPTAPVMVDVTGLIVWTADVVGMPLEFETPSSVPMPAGSRDYAAEAARFEAASQRDPNDVTTWVRLGQARRGLGDLPGALAAFTQAAQLSPNSEEARVGLALTYLSQGQVARARAALDPVRDQATALAVLGLADLHEGQTVDAAHDLLAALAKDPQLYPARALLALTYLARNDLAEAETAAQEAVRQEPDSAQTEGTLAMVLFFSGKPQAAKAASKRAVQLNPRSPFALLTEGRTLLAGQHTDAARAAFEKAASLAPYLWLAHQELGAVYLRLDMPKKADEEYRIALHLNPGSADAHTGRGVALQRQGGFAEAEKEHRQALVLDPSSATAHYNLATLFIDRGQLEAARQELESGVQAAPERGILYARLAELSLYHQDLFQAQEFALHAVRLLPNSAIAHYELGRVYLEQDRTVQAEEEFRQAATLDRQFAEARYALGLTQQKTDAGLLSSFSSLLDSALVGSPGSTLSLENLQTPGAEQRVQAALLDPTVVRVASRSYGNTQLDVRLGEQGTRDLAGSYLSETSDKRGVRGLTGEEQATNGVRANADSKRDTATVVFGQKAAGGPSGFFLSGDYEDTSQGTDTLTESDPFSATQRYHLQFSRLLAGFNSQAGERSRLRTLVQVSNYNFGYHDLADAENHNHFNIRSLNGELRWDANLGEDNFLSVGFSLGSRQRQTDASADSPDPMTPAFQIVVSTKVQPYQAYIRDEVRINPRLTLMGEMQVQRLDTFDSTNIIGLAGFSPTQESHQKAFGVPNAIVSYQLDARSSIRLRARRLFATVSDFQLLTPTDVFLLSFAGLPQASGLFPSSDGSSVELEYDHTFDNASFVRVGAFKQDLRQAEIPSSLGGGPYGRATVRGVRASYEGLIGRDLSFFLSGDINHAHDSETDQRIAQVPEFDGLASLQYLNRRGYYAQAAYYYQGYRLKSDDDQTPLGGFGVLNLRVGKRMGLRSNVFVELNNVFNQQYDVFGELQPSRQLAVGISERF